MDDGVHARDAVTLQKRIVYENLQDASLIQGKGNAWHRQRVAHKTEELTRLFIRADLRRLDRSEAPADDMPHSFYVHENVRAQIDLRKRTPYTRTFLCVSAGSAMLWQFYTRYVAAVLRTDLSAMLKLPWRIGCARRRWSLQAIVEEAGVVRAAHGGAYRLRWAAVAPRSQHCCGAVNLCTAS